MTLHWSFDPTCHLLMGGNTQEYDAARYPHTLVMGLVPTPGDSPQNPAREDRMLRAYLRKVVGSGGPLGIGRRAPTWGAWSAGEEVGEEQVATEGLSWAKAPGAWGAHWAGPGREVVNVRGAASALGCSEWVEWVLRDR